MGPASVTEVTTGDVILTDVPAPVTGYAETAPVEVGSTSSATLTATPATPNSGFVSSPSAVADAARRNRVEPGAAAGAGVGDPHRKPKARQSPVESAADVLGASLRVRSAGAAGDAHNGRVARRSARARPRPRSGYLLP